MDVLVDGRGLVESPRWHDGRIWFSDWIAGEIIAVSPDDGRAEVIVTHPSLPLCFDFLPDGRLLVVSGPEAALLTPEPDGTLTRYAALPGACNDIVVDGAGNVWVNSPNYDVAAGPPDTPEQPGYVAVVTAAGETRTVATDLAFPNGMAVTADGRTLLVAESHRCQITAFDIGADCALSNRRVWAGLGDHPPDGICLDTDGALWYADVPHECCVRVREGGEVLDTVTLDRGGFACMLGGDSLYITAAHFFGMKSFSGELPWDGQLLRVPAPARASGFPAAD